MEESGRIHPWRRMGRKRFPAFILLAALFFSATAEAADITVADDAPYASFRNIPGVTKAEIQAV